MTNCQGTEVMGTASNKAVNTLYDADGLIALYTGSAVRVCVPRLTSEGHYMAVMSGLDQVWRRCVGSRRWVVDVSAVETLPLSMMTALTAIAEGLKEEDGEFVLVSVRNAPIRLDDSTRRAAEYY